MCTAEYQPRSSARKNRYTERITLYCSLGNKKGKQHRITKKENKNLTGHYERCPFLHGPRDLVTVLSFLCHIISRLYLTSLSASSPFPSLYFKYALRLAHDPPSDEEHVSPEMVTFEAFPKTPKEPKKKDPLVASHEDKDRRPPVAQATARPSVRTAWPRIRWLGSCSTFASFLTRRLFDDQGRTDRPT